jgi:AraC family transcriptional regulator
MKSTFDQPSTLLRTLGGVTLLALEAPAGPFIVESTDRLSIILHRSASTRTYCKEIGRHFVRRVNDIDVVPAGEVGGYEAESDFNALMVSIPSWMIEEARGDIVEKQTLKARHLLRDHRIVQLVSILEMDRRSGFPSERLFIDGIAMAMTSRLLSLDRPPNYKAGRLSDRQLKRVLDYIEEHMDAQLSLDTLSKVAAVSSSHLRTWFKAATGSSVHRFVLRQRTERAREMLLETALSISEVAEMTGFANQSHLTQWMRRETGSTPRVIRKSR